jgi:hypothetical protein
MYAYGLIRGKAHGARFESKRALCGLSLRGFTMHAVLPSIPDSPAVCAKCREAGA